MSWKVLIADDEPDVQELLKIALQQKGWIPVFASDGDQTLSLAEKEQPQAVILDVVLPGRSGWEVCEALKSNPATQHIKVLMLSALMQPSVMRRAFQTGADAYLTKPINAASLLQKMEAVIQQRR
jgi:DNA-binding response OmpR family regulator